MSDGLSYQFQSKLLFIFFLIKFASLKKRYQNVEVFVDDILVSKTSGSFRVPEDYIITIPISKTGKILRLQWPKVSVSVATLEVSYNEGETIHLFHLFLFYHLTSWWIYVQLWTILTWLKITERFSFVFFSLLQLHPSNFSLLLMKCVSRYNSEVAFLIF